LDVFYSGCRAVRGARVGCRPASGGILNLDIEQLSRTPVVVPSMDAPVTSTGGLAALVARYTSSGFYRAGILNQNGQLYAIIEKCTFTGTGKFTTKRLATQRLGALGTLTFQTVGTSLKLTINIVTLTATDSTYKSGSVGILGSAGTKFATFVGAVASGSTSVKKTANTGMAVAGIVSPRKTYDGFTMSGVVAEGPYAR
jgi:hypothetical protein